VGSNDRNIYALNASDGALLWNYTTGDVVISSPAVAEGVVYVGSYNGIVYALDAAAGRLLWNFETSGLVASSPAVADGLVYVGSGDDKIYALQASTGTAVWNYTTGGDVASSPAVAEGVVYVGSCDGKVYALNAFTGDALWSYLTGDLVVSSPAVANGVVYVGSYDRAVYAIGSPVASGQRFTVSFTASGLPSERSWSVTLDSETQTSSSETITFSVSNGVHPFSVTPPAGYSAAPFSGTVTVSSADVSREVAFVSVADTSSPVIPLLSVTLLLLAFILAAILYKRSASPYKLAGSRRV
jgi:outer membrane protein assembly factor BamB